VRVLIVSAHFRPHVGGIERFSETLALGLAGRAHDVCVVCCRTEPVAPLLEEGPYRVRRVPSSTLPERRLGVPYPLPAPAQLLRTLRSEVAAADIVHVQDALYATSVIALLLARRRRVPTLLTQHVAFVPQGSRALDAAQRIALATLGRAARLATSVVAVNAEVASWAERSWGLPGVAVERVGATPAGAVDRAATRRELGLDEDRFVALFVGRDVPKKGLDVFLGAADPAYDLVAVTNRSGPDARATVLPFMPPEQLSRLLSSADAFVLPSEAEGIPVALQEAMTHGVPVVATYASGYASVFEPTDIAPVERDSESVRAALLRLAQDPSEHARLAARSRAVGADRFSLEAFVEAYETRYREVVAAPRSSE
jgi:glycosyltransferase involved in cell wall biosynthesis